MTSIAAMIKNTLITVPNTNTDNIVEVSIPPDMINNLVKLLPCFITTDMIKPLEA